MEENQNAETPTKEQVISMLKEQIEVKSVQLELQEINEKLAKSRAGELQALQFIAQMTNPQPEGVPHTLTQEDIDNNPELEEQGFKAGDEVMVPKEAASSRKLKKDK